MFGSNTNQQIPENQKREDDKKIVKFICDFQKLDDIKYWNGFDHPINESLSLIPFNIKGLFSKYKYNFLDRIKLTSINNEVLYATIIGEHQNELYIHLDRTGNAEPLSKYLNNLFIAIRTDSCETQFKSITEFAHLHLGRYLEIHNEYEFNKSNSTSNPKTRTFFKSDFRAEVMRNEAYLKIAKLYLQMSPRLVGKSL